jgi:Protein of unknown function (DUF1552)
MTIKLSMYRRLGRRDLAKAIGSAALALPLLELFGDEVAAQTVPKKSKFVVFLYTPDGVNNKAFWPSGPDPSSSPTLSVFAPYKDKMMVLGPRFSSPGVPTTDTGLTYNTKPAQHRANMTLSASSVNLPLNPDQFHVVNKIDVPSVDYLIGTALAAADGANHTPFPYLNFGLHPIGGDTPSEINFDDKGTPLPRMASADEVWTRLFGGMMGSAGAASELHKLNAVTDFLNSRFATLRPELSAFDRQTVDGHLAALRTFSDRKSRQLMGQTNPMGICAGPAAAKDRVPVDETSVRTGADTEFLSAFFMQTIAAAFACNMTRVASVTFGYPGGGGEGGLRMPWLTMPGGGNFTDALHAVSHHGGGAEKLTKYQLMNGWIASQVKYLMDQLAAVTTPTGTLLDQTTLYWFNRHGDGEGHTNFALPNVLLGGTGGYFKMGQVLSLPKTSPTKVLISIANAMGVELASLGSGALRDTAPLAGITA